MGGGNGGGEYKVTPNTNPLAFLFYFYYCVVPIYTVLQYPFNFYSLIC